jgi:hypothetical protein
MRGGGNVADLGARGYHRRQHLVGRGVANGVHGQGKARIRRASDQLAGRAALQERDPRLPLPVDPPRLGVGQRPEPVQPAGAQRTADAGQRDAHDLGARRAHRAAARAVEDQLEGPGAVQLATLTGARPAFHRVPPRSQVAQLGHRHRRHPDAQARLYQGATVELVHLAGHGRIGEVRDADREQLVLHRVQTRQHRVGRSREPIGDPQPLHGTQRRFDQTTRQPPAPIPLVTSARRLGRCLADARPLERQRAGDDLVAAVVKQQDRVLRAGRVQIVAGWMASLAERELVVAEPNHPGARLERAGSIPETGEQHVEGGRDPRPAVHAGLERAAHRQVVVRVDEARDHCPDPQVH